MGVEKMSEEHIIIRKVLGDVSNQIGKRGFSAFLGDVTGDKSADENCRTDGMAVMESGYMKDKDTGKRARPCIEINSLKGNVLAGISGIPSDQKEPNLLDFTIESTVIQGTSKTLDDSKTSADDVSRYKSTASVSDYVDVEVICDSDEGRIYSRGSQEDDTIVSVEGDANGVDSFVLSQTGSVDCTRFPESQESVSFELERCTGLKGIGGSSSSIDDPFITSCSCSFCKKAAYIWFDLHYQDMKGLISALKKSQKDASVLAERTSRSKGKGIQGTSCSGKQSNLEYDLIAQWRSLFQRMEGMFAREGKQLETRLLPLKDLREKCKMALQLVNPTPTQNE